MLKGSKKFNKHKGDKGEDIASYFLIEKGYKVLERNFSRKYGELDIIATKGDTLVCIEVKTQSLSDSEVAPEDHFNRRKYEKVKRTFYQYIVENNMTEMTQRIDLIAIVFDNNTKKAKVKHYKNVNID